MGISETSLATRLITGMVLMFHMHDSFSQLPWCILTLPGRSLDPQPSPVTNQALI